MIETPLPGQWVDLAGQILLRRTAAQIALAERLEAWLRDPRDHGRRPEALAAEAELRGHAWACLEERHCLPDGLEGHASEHGCSRGPSQVRARTGLRPPEIVAKEIDGQP